MKSYICLCYLLISSIFLQLNADYIFNGTSAFIRVGAGASLVLSKPLTVIRGSILKDSQATISGSSMSFVDGVYQDINGQISFNGMFDNLSTFTINQQTMHISQGVSNILAKGINNRIDGLPQFLGTVALQDAQTTLTVAIQANIEQNLTLNGGVVYLGDGLTFNSTSQFVGPGTIVSNGYPISLSGGDLSWTKTLTWNNAGAINLSTGNMTLTGLWVFVGTNRIDGNGNSITLSGSGGIIIESGSQLTLKNIYLKGVTGSNVRCVDTNGSLALDGVTWVQSGSFTFSTGSISYNNTVLLTGTNTGFIYTSRNTSTIRAAATLTLDAGLTYSYDPRTVASTTLLLLEDSSAKLILNGATFYTTVTGATFTKGAIALTAASNIATEKLGTLDQGVTLGDGSNSNNDCVLLLNGYQLNVTQGSLHYMNVSPYSLVAGTAGVINIYTGATLYNTTNLYLNYLGLGTIYFYDNSTWLCTTGKDIVGGAVVSLGTLTRTLI